VTIVAFIFQDIARMVVIACSLRVIWGVRKFTSPNTPESTNAYEVKKRIQFLWRTLFSLIILELLEMCVKFVEVESICDAPYVTQMRQKRHPNMTAADLKVAQDRCILISDLYDYFFEGMTVVLLVYLTWIVHSYGRSVKGEQQQQRHADYQQDSSLDNAQTQKQSAVVVGQVVRAEAADI
jgi:hypothetical protein